MSITAMCDLGYHGSCSSVCVVDSDHTEESCRCACHPAPVKTPAQRLRCQRCPGVLVRDPYEADGTVACLNCGHTERPKGFTVLREPPEQRPRYAHGVRL